MPDDDQYNPSKECMFCGFPFTAHGGLDSSWQSYVLDNWKIWIALYDNGLQTLSRAYASMPVGWTDFCERLTSAMFVLDAAERRLVALERREQRLAEEATRLWEMGLL